MRDFRTKMTYWDEWTAFSEERIQKVKRISEGKAASNPRYEPQYVLDLAWRYLRLMLQRYSRGDAVNDLVQHFSGFLDSWEEAERLGKDVWGEREQYFRHAWSINFHYYMDCFWLVGLALTLNISNGQWQRLLVLMGNEGEDALLDRVIASRQLDRKIGDRLCFPGAYRGLLQVVDAPADAQPRLLRVYLERWFTSLKNAGSPEMEPYLRTPYWYAYGDENLEGGAYFGRWCIEAVAVAKAFGIDDSLCLDHPNYPGDLIEDNRCPRYPDPVAPPEPDMSAITFGQGRNSSSDNWLSRLLLGPRKRR